MGASTPETPTGAPFLNPLGDFFSADSNLPTPGKKSSGGRPWFQQVNSELRREQTGRKAKAYLLDMARR